MGVKCQNFLVTTACLNLEVFIKLRMRQVSSRISENIFEQRLVPVLIVKCEEFFPLRHFANGGQADIKIEVLAKLIKNGNFTFISGHQKQASPLV